MSSVGVVVDTTEERRRSVLTDVLGEKMTTTGVLVHERRYVVHKAGDENERALSSLLLDYMRKLR